MGAPKPLAQNDPQEYLSAEKDIQFLHKLKEGGLTQWLRPVIPDIWEAQTGGWWLKDSPSQKKKLVRHHPIDDLLSFPISEFQVFFP